MADLVDDPNDPRLGRGIDTGPTEQHEAYLVLSEAERAKGFVAPLRTAYKHVGKRRVNGQPIERECGAVTHMRGSGLSETYAARPDFYGATMCVACQMHLRVGSPDGVPRGEFVWLTEDGREDVPRWWVGTLPVLAEDKPIVVRKGVTPGPTAILGADEVAAYRDPIPPETRETLWTPEKESSPTKLWDPGSAVPSDFVRETARAAEGLRFEPPTSAVAEFFNDVWRRLDWMFEASRRMVEGAGRFISRFALPLWLLAFAAMTATALLGPTEAWVAFAAATALLGFLMGVRD